MRKKQSNPSTKKRDISHIKPYQWKKGGRSPNPLGRPKNLSLTEVLSHLLTEPEPNDPQGRSRIELLAIALWADAYSGNQRMREEIWNRLDGKVKGNP